MIEWLICFIVSLICAYGMSVILVEKGDDFPVNKLVGPLKTQIFWALGPQASDVLDCSTCLSFWTALLTDIVICCIAFTYFNTIYFLWPLTGFAVAGINWTIYEFLNAIDPRD